MTQGRGQAHGSSGQAIAELALVAPVMLLLMLLAVDFGRLFFTYIAVNNAAREATYYAAEHAKDTSYTWPSYRAGTTQAALKETNAQGQGGAGAMSVSDPHCYTPPDTATGIDCHAASQFANGIGNQVTVEASQPFSFLTPIVGELFGGQLTLTASATAPILNPLDATIFGPSPAPTVSPSPSPSPSPSSSLPPGTTPTPSPSPTPVPTCTVPDFKNGFWHNTGGVPALTVWHDQAGFTGTLTNLAGTERIKSQTLTRDSVVPCTSDMSVDD